MRIIHGLPEYPLNLIDHSVWLFLAAKCRGSPLMPRLHKLFAHNVAVSDISVLTFLISPTLRVADLSFVLEDEDEDKDGIAPHVVSSLLHTLPFMAPDLEDLSYDVDFTIARRPAVLKHGHLESFRHHTKMKSLSISCEVALDLDHVLLSLSSIPTLQSLTCTSIVLSMNAALALPQVTFPRLIDLHLGGHFDHLIAFFEACQLPCLASITLEITAQSSVRKHKDSLAAISRRCNPATLTSFSFEISRISSPNSSSPDTLMQIFEPLLAFPNIRAFRFYCFNGVPPMHDTDLAQFGAAWPQLTRFCILHLTGKYSLPHVARPTLPGLIALAQHCPHLDDLRIPELDATIVPPKHVVPVLEHGLRYFAVRNIMYTLPSEASLDAAAVLDRVFPALDLEHARSEHVLRCRSGTGWTDVVRFLEAMRLGRENRDDRLRE